MKRAISAAVLGLAMTFGAPREAQAYDIDCAIMLCMAGGFPPSAVCARAYRTMIRRITPWPVLPPFGICTYAAAPVELGGPGGEADLDVLLPEYAWLRRTQVYWFQGSAERDRGGDILYWYWWVNACDHENGNCRRLVRVGSSSTPWPSAFVSANGQTIPYPGRDGGGREFTRAVMVEYGDYEGNMDHSEWFSY